MQCSQSDHPDYVPFMRQLDCSLMDNTVGRDYDWRIAQEVEFGRQSGQRVCVRKQIGVVTTPWIAWNCYHVSEGNHHI